jgi:hypothetical protein
MECRARDEQSGGSHQGILLGVEPIRRIIVTSVGLSKAGSNSSRRTLALDFEFG